MTYPTCQDAYDALTHCIEQRWKPLAEMRYANVPSCALCHFDERCSSEVNYRTKECAACPLKLVDPRGCGENSLYMNWDHQATEANAQAVLNKLLEVKQHFFGDWK